MILQTVIIGVLVLGVLVFVHELGHFVVAKLNGIRVLAFSIGFGKPLLTRTIGDTEYRISAIPFGGYVHMAGEHPEDEHESKPDEFNAKPIWRRALVAVGGPGANFIMSFMLLWLVFMAGVQHERYLDRPVIGAVVDTSAADSAGMQAGDSIISINGSPVSTWQDIQQALTREAPPYTVTLFRDQQRIEVVVPMDNPMDAGLQGNPMGGMLPAVPAKVGNVQPQSAAMQAGIQKGDSILAINDQRIHSWFQLTWRVSDYDSASGPLRVRIERDGSVMTVTATPEYNEENNRYLLGIGAATAQTRTIRYGPVAAIGKAGERSWEYTTMIFDVLGKLFSRQVSPDQLAGPVGIVQMSGVVALGGLTAILNFMALIGINLAVLNLFPLVITDGGLLMFLALEKIRGKPLSLQAQMTVNRIAIAAFIALFLFVTFNDVKRIPQLFRMLGQ
jgi:regulator of sigma E protease